MIFRFPTSKYNFQWLVHGSGLEPLYDAGKCSEAELASNLRSMYVAVMGFMTVRTGNTSHLRPTSFIEVFEPGTLTAEPRQLDASDGKFDDSFVGKSEVQLEGFGIPFVQNGLDNRIHNARVAIVDFAGWKLRHYLHFLSKLAYSKLFYTKKIIFFIFWGFLIEN